MNARRPAPAELVDALKQRFGARCSTSAAVCEQHGRDESPFDPAPPDVVVFAESTQDVADAIGLCARHKTPVIPYGAGSSIEGHLLAVQGGVSIDVSAMNCIVAIDAEDLIVTVQPGVTRKRLNEEIRDTGLFFPIASGGRSGRNCDDACGQTGARPLQHHEPGQDLRGGVARGRTIDRCLRQQSGALPKSPHPATSLTRVISLGAPKRSGGPQ